MMTILIHCWQKTRSGLLFVNQLGNIIKKKQQNLKMGLLFNLWICAREMLFKKMTHEEILWGVTDNSKNYKVC